MKNEVKKWLAVVLLRWSFSIMPDCKFKVELAKLIINELGTGLD
jgi:hypothetical protein